VVLYLLVALGRDRDHVRTAGGGLLDVRDDLVVDHLLVDGDADDRRVGVQERDRPVLHLARRIALGVDVGDLLQLERALERDRVVDAAADVEEVLRLAILLRDPLEQLLAREALADERGNGDEVAHELPPAVGVAATKTFTAQVALLSLLALKLAEIRRTLPQDEIDFILDRLLELPEKMQEFLDGEHPIDSIAERFHDAPFFLYLGRHIGLPVALEGALKLKEISYIPTDAYSAGEMKHGPIALLDEGTPVVVVATNIHVYDKIVSNIQETRARGAHVIAIATDGNEDIQHHADDVIYVPRTPNFLQASLAVIPLQLLAYRIARLRGLNVDQPRNLAKTVTVE